VSALAKGRRWLEEISQPSTSFLRATVPALIRELSQASTQIMSVGSAAA
jgi:hypothetical protein